MVSHDPNVSPGLKVHVLVCSLHAVSDKTRGAVSDKTRGADSGRGSSSGAELATNPPTYAV